MAQNVVGDRANNGSKAVSVVFSSMKPWLYVEAPKGNDAVQFYKAAFGAEEVIRVDHPKRKAEQELPLILAAELKLGSCTFIVSDLTDEGSSLVKSGVSGSVFCLETIAVAKAVSAGAVSEGEILGSEGACCGGRVGKIKDPYGNLWFISSPSEEDSDDVPLI